MSKVSEYGNDTHHHHTTIFRDMPSPGTTTGYERQWHLNGRSPVLELETLITKEDDDVAFLVIRTVHCFKITVSMAHADISIHWTEGIHVKSKIAKHAIQDIATCYFHPFSDTDTSTYKRLPAPVRKQQLVDEPVFLFHHRHLLQDYTVLHPASKPHIDALLKYTSDRFGTEFAEADNLFARGLVTQAHVSKLFKPNELAVIGTHGRPATFVVQKWPQSGGDGWVEMNCWSLQADGSGFVRKQNHLSISPIGLVL
jgi:hypothetical protein